MTGTQTCYDVGLMKQLYRKMLEIRSFEERVTQLFMEGLLPGTIHTCDGQEAVCVGVCAHLRQSDSVLSGHRGHGHALAKGVSMRGLMAELFGKKTGICKGKGGSMHPTDVSVGFLGGNAIVAATIPIASGVGLSIRLRNTDDVCVCFLGDGATTTGAFHEGVNLAAVWRLPVVFVCENNLYSGTTRIDNVTVPTDLSVKAVAYGMPGQTVDGMDVMAIYEAAGEAITRARKDRTPTLLEFKTYRFSGYSRADPPFGMYRTREDLQAWKARDPLQGVLKSGMVTKAEAHVMEQEVQLAIDDAVRYAKDSPFPEPEESYEDVWA